LVKKKVFAKTKLKLNSRYVKLMLLEKVEILIPIYIA
jgi:hypothetical protein